MADTRPFAGLAQDSKIDELLLQLTQLVDVLSFLSPDTASRLRVAVETAPTTTVTGTLTGVTTVSTVSSVTAVANQTNMGGIATNQHMIALTLMTEADLRRNIVIS